jgi:ABC-type transport system involved in cytochrome bd biosynthesis fused ATPase/permease subunit
MWVTLDWSTYNLSSSLSDRIASVYTIHMSVTFPLIFHFRTFLEKYLSQNLLFFRVSIVVLHIVIVWLIKYASSVMIAVRIFVPVSSHLVDNLSLSRLRT